MKLSVLILPGFASSGLEVIESDIDESHEKDRVWMNPIALGFGALHFGDAYKKSDRPSNTEDDAVDDDPDEDLKSNLGNLSDEKYKSALKCQSAWIHHLSLADNKISERGRNKIRPIEGLDGVDFLTDIASFKVGASYVFGPVIEALVSAGFEKGVNLDAAPYDFRLPPIILEQRDQYFTRTLSKIEEIYSKNNDTPVVLLCHSLGCKIGHYLLNFAEQNKGRAWIDQYIHTYMPVGAPHIGAREMVVQEFSPSTGSPVDGLMSQEEKLILFRSWGSCVWMMPRHLPPRTVATPGLICRREGCLEITLKGLIGDCDVLVRNKNGTRDINGVRLYISYGGEKARSQYAKPIEEKKQDDGSGVYFEIGDKFVFSTKPSLEGGLDALRVELREPGSLRAHEREKKGKLITGLRFIDKDYHTRLLINKATESSDSAYSSLAISEEFKNLHELLAATKPNVETGCHEIKMSVTINARVDTKLLSMEAKKDARHIVAEFNVKWIPPPEKMPNSQITPVAELPEGTDIESPLPVVSKENENHQYQRVSGQFLLRGGMGDEFFNLVQNQYENDEMGPRQKSAEDAPPVQRVFAIYGVNVPTTDGAVFCRPPAQVVSGPHRVKQRYIVDKTVNIETEAIQSHTSAFGDYELKDGKIIELPHKTKQKDLITGETKYISGDGTVPYWSLQHVRTWKSNDCDVRTEEVEGAVHRDILADKRFHRTLIEYVCGRDGIKEVESKAALKMQELASMRKKRMKNKDEKKLSW